MIQVPLIGTLNVYLMKEWNVNLKSEHAVAGVIPVAEGRQHLQAVAA